MPLDSSISGAARIPGDRGNDAASGARVAAAGPGALAHPLGHSPGCGDHDRHRADDPPVPRARARQWRARTRKHRAAAQPAFRPAVGRSRSTPERPHRAVACGGHRISRRFQAPDVDAGDASADEDQGQRADRNRRHQRLRLRRHPDQFIGGGHRSGRQYRRSCLFQHAQMGPGAAADRTGPQPLLRGHENGHRPQGDRAERRIPGRGLPRHIPGKIRGFLFVGDARNGRRDRHVPSRRDHAGAPSACRADDRPEIHLGSAAREGYLPRAAGRPCAGSEVRSTIRTGSGPPPG